MGIISQVAVLLQSALGSKLDTIGRQTGAIKRQRKFSGQLLFQMVVMTTMKNPKPTPDDFVITAAQLGVVVTPEAVKKRFTKELVSHLEEGLQHLLTHVFTAAPPAIPLLNKFTSVEIGDSTTVTLPDEFETEFPGCGGKTGSGKAAAKIQVVWELRGGTLTKLAVGPGRHSDAKSVAVDDPVAAGSLSIRDLGYFGLERFRWIGRQKAYWISRLQQNTAVFSEDGQPLALLDYLGKQPTGAPVDVSIFLGGTERLACRLIALRVPAEMANRRRQAAYEKAQKHGRVPTQEHLDLCNWTIFVTNCPADLLTWKEVVVLYRIRWQIELMFKLWKSCNQLATAQEHWTNVERMAMFWSKLIGVVLQHWLLLTSTWSDIRRSHWKAARVVREWILVLARALGDLDDLIRDLEKMVMTIECVARKKLQSKRPSSFQLLMNPELLEWKP